MGNYHKSISQKIGRNDPCPCGSGKKFKKCHYQTQWQSRMKSIEVEKKLKLEKIIAEHALLTDGWPYRQKEWND